MILRLICLSLSLLFFQGTSQADPLDLDALIEEALRENPSLRAVEHRIEAAEARVSQAGALDDPVLGFEARNIPLSRFDFATTPMSGKAISLHQAFPFPGVLRAKTAAARFEAGIVRATLRERRSVITNLVKQAYFELDFLDHAIEIARENERLLSEITELALHRYEVGEGIQADILRVQIARGMVLDRLLEFDASRKSSASRLNLVLNRPLDSPVGPTKPSSPHMLQETETDLRRIAAKHRGLLSALTHAAERWKAEAQVASRQGWPGFRVGMDYVQRQAVPGDPVIGEDFVTLRVRLTLPVFAGRKQRQSYEEAMARSREKEAERIWETNRANHEIRESALEVRQHHEQHLLFESTILPQAEQALESALSAYRVGRTDLRAVLDAQQDLLRAALRNHHHRVSHAKLLAELEAVVGTRLFSEVGSEKVRP